MLFKRFINNDPKILPFEARIYIFGSIMALGLIIILSSGSLMNKLCACGIIFGLFGAGVLYWETIANDVSILSVSREIERSSQTHSSGPATDITIITLFANIGYFILFLPSIINTFKDYNMHHDSYHTFRSTLVIFIAAALPALGVWAIQSIIGRWSSKWLVDFRAKPEAEIIFYIKKFLRSTGFATLFISGIMQLPSYLF